MTVSPPVCCFSYIAGAQLIFPLGTITLQNLNGPGKGCPNVATTFAVSHSITLLNYSARPNKPSSQAQSLAIDAGKDTPPAAAPPAASSPSVKTTAPANAAPAPSQPAPAPPANNNPVNGITRDIVAKLAPDLGSSPNNNPNRMFRSICNWFHS